MASAATLLLSFTLPITASYAQGQGASLSSATASQSVTQASESVVKAFAPSGTLRASINLGNPVLASIDPAAGKPVGVSVDLATELARRLGVPLQLVVVKSAGASVDNVNQDKADVGFFTGAATKIAAALNPHGGVFQLDQRPPDGEIENDAIMYNTFILKDCLGTF